MFTADFFAGNRQRLYKALPQGSIIMLAANGALQQMPDGAYAFAQEANFWYITGIEHADWQFWADTSTGEEWLVQPALSRVEQLFAGGLSSQDAASTSGIRVVLAQRAATGLGKKMRATGRTIYSIAPPPRRLYGFYTNPAQAALWRTLPKEMRQDIRLPMAKLRGIKQHIEIKALQESIDITVAGLNALRKALPDMRHEYEAEALLSYEFRRRKARHGFDPILAAGQNACTIHYEQNNGPLAGDWLLCDVGARLPDYGYSADIARTFSLGEPNTRSLAVYEAVLRVRDAAVGLLKPGQSTRAYQESVEAHMHHEMMVLGLLPKKSVPRDIYTARMPHAIGHGLGVDLHDPLGRPEFFAENMVLTVELGIYVPEEAIGVRLEDDILITATGATVLSAGLPTKLA